MDLPVYRLTEEQYYAEREKDVREDMKQAGIDPNSAHPLRGMLETSYGGPWQYNEIIGYIRLHFLGSQIRGEYFSVRAKRIVRTRKKMMNMLSHKLVSELGFAVQASSADIYAVILKYVQRCREELPGRYIDVSILEAIGPYVDWRRMWEGAR